ncbi:MAG: acetyl-CoA carboxylase biotin carboxyl carrier protein [Thermoleophilia bacterium]|nr:acetyl-CoA carboxylase biotin carboxyl carrier protein [Thermoleophilia bacterium]
MPKLVDTTIRLLGQEPLAGRVPTARLLELAELLDTAGYAYLEVSGGGVFDSAVRRGVESPWERIRGLKARTTTPLAMALRGRFLVGSRPVDADVVRRFVASAAENGIEVFRLHDPLNDVENLREASEAIAAAGCEFDAGLVYSSGRTGETETLVEQAAKLPELGAARLLLHDPTGSLQPTRTGELVRALGEASGLPVGVYLQGAGGSALAAALESARVGADLVACALYPVALALHRVSGESLAQALPPPEGHSGVDVRVLWRGCDIVDEHIGDEPVTPLAPRIAVRAAEYALPAGLVAALDAHLRAHAAGDRIDEVLDELARIRLETGSAPLASPVGQILASQALLHVLSASRWTTIVDELRDLLEGRYGRPPGPVDPAVARAATLLADGRPPPEPVELRSLRETAAGLAASEEELLLLALFGSDAEPLLEAIRTRARRDEGRELATVEQSRAERIREIVRIVQESRVGEVTIEDDDFRVTVRRTEETAAAPALPGTPEESLLTPAGEAAADGVVRVESPMVGTFYRAPQPGAPPFVEVGDVVAPGQTICLIEAMKLFNELKAEVEGVVREVLVENGQPVEFGQALFELEPLAAAPPAL